MNAKVVRILFMFFCSMNELFSTSEKVYVCKFDTKPDAITMKNLEDCCEGLEVQGQADKKADMPTCKNLKGSMGKLKSCCEKNKGHAHRYSVKESK